MPLLLPGRPTRPPPQGISIPNKPNFRIVVNGAGVAVALGLASVVLGYFFGVQPLDGASFDTTSLIIGNIYPPAFPIIALAPMDSPPFLSDCLFSFVIPPVHSFPFTYPHALSVALLSRLFVGLAVLWTGPVPQFGPRRHHDRSVQPEHLWCSKSGKKEGGKEEMLVICGD